MVSPATAGLIGLALMLILIFLGVSLPFSFLISGFIGVTLILGFQGGLTYLRTIPVTTSMSYTLSVLPMIIAFIIGQEKLIKGMMAGAVKG